MIVGEWLDEAPEKHAETTMTCQRMPDSASRSASVTAPSGCGSIPSFDTSMVAPLDP